MDREKYSKSIVKLLDDEIIKIKEKYKDFETIEFNGPVIILLLANKDLSDDDLLIDFYNKEDDYHMISSKKEAIEFIRKGNLKYINIAYSNKYIIKEIVKDIKKYILNYNTFTKEFCDKMCKGYDLNNHVKHVMILNLEKYFLDMKKNLIDYINECIDETVNYNNIDDEMNYVEDIVEFDEIDVDSIYEFLDNDSVVNKILDVETIKEAKECFNPMFYNSYTELHEFLEDDEYLTFLIKKYYESKFNNFETMYIKGTSDINFKYKNTNEYKYRKLLLDLFNKLNSDSDEKLYIMMDILNGIIMINSSYYDSYIGDIVNYDKLLFKLKLIIIFDYYKNSISNYKILDNDDKSYIAYISEEVVTLDKIIELFKYEEEFAKKAILGFLNYNSNKNKKSIDKKYAKVLKKINPFNN